MPTGASKLDEFESLFRSAIHEVFHFSPPVLTKALLVTDLDEAASNELLVKVQAFLASIDSAQSVTWQVASREAWVGTDAPPMRVLLDLVEASETQLIVTYRHLLGTLDDLPHTLGSVVDTLTQATPAPVLLLPPLARLDFDGLLRHTHSVMVVTDHITGDDDLVNWGVHFTHIDGTLYLAHIEDDATLEHYLDAISKIRGIETDHARKEIPAKLLEIPQRYLETVAGVLEKNDVRETVVPLVRLGHAITDYRKLLDEHNIDLLIVNTKDAQQSAMQAMAYALAVEIRHRPLLLL